MHFLFETARRAVIKLGSGILTTQDGNIDQTRIGEICRQIDVLTRKGIQVIIVSSGAITLGMSRLGIKRRPTDMTTLQACAAVGQSILTDIWQTGFNPFSHTVAQILLTREDVRVRDRHVAVKDLFDKLLSEGIVPVVNENDSVSTEEIKFGENDVLSSLVASLTKADILIMLSVIPGLIDREGTGNIVPVVETITPELERLAWNTKSSTSVGGMRTKIEAAKIAVKSGCGVFIGNGKDDEILIHLLNGQAQGTFFVPDKIPLASKKRWLAFFERPHGEVRVDEGARNALCHGGSSLLASGIIAINGTFEVGSVVTITIGEGEAIARGISQFSSSELAQIVGESSDQIRIRFPQRKRLEAVHRDSMVMLQ